MNLSVVIGNLGSDAVVKESNGNKFVSFSVAESRTFKNANGESQTVTNWIDCVMNGSNHAVLPYLKQGTKVSVVGTSSLRVYSSRRDRMMKAGQTIHVMNIELVGAQPDAVPRQLIVPETGQLVDVQKFYHGNLDVSKLKDGECIYLIDRQGRYYEIEKHGWVKPSEVMSGSQSDQQGAAADSGQGTV